MLVPSSPRSQLCRFPKRCWDLPVNLIVDFVDCPCIYWECWHNLDQSQGRVWFFLQWLWTVGNSWSPGCSNHWTWCDRDVFLSQSGPFYPSRGLLCRFWSLHGWSDAGSCPSVCFSDFQPSPLYHGSVLRHPPTLLLNCGLAGLGPQLPLAPQAYSGLP